MVEKKPVMLKVKVDFATGIRAGGINPRDRGLLCDPSWQNIDEGVELRLVTDERDIEQYRNVEGVTVIEGLDACNAEIEAIREPLYAVAVPELLNISIQKKNIRIDDIDPALPPEKQLEILHQKGALGIRKITPRKLK